PTTSGGAEDNNSLAVAVTVNKRRFEQISNQDDPQNHLPSKRTRRRNNILPQEDLMDDVQSSSDAPKGATTAEAQMSEDKLEAIAIIGVSLRFAQDATSPAGFWDMMMAGRSAATDIPKDRFNVDAFYKAGSSKTGLLNARGGHFVKENIAAFDAPFFTMTPAEAESMDPLQRWLLETSYEALENAGVPIHTIAGSKTSVHIGAFLREYEFMLCRDPQMKAKYKASGTAFAMLANRLSWFFDLMGPSVAIDTACSSSLYALHQACQSLRSGDSTMGIVGGCNLFYNPDSMTELTDLNFLSKDSRCYSFDHRANGYSRGEGFGIVILKKLSDALRDGDTIRAVIRATGTNQDGRTPGITQPSSQAQQVLIRDTYAAGGLDMSLTRFFEAHGTGTPMGDPLEAKAIHSAFQESSTKDQPLYVGAVKTNIGHCEGAAGVAGLIKAIMILEKGVIPPNTNFERPNPKILVDKWNIKVCKFSFTCFFPLEPTPWPTDGLRRASVNSFGFGGANAHAVLDDAYNYLKSRGLVGKHCTVPLPPKRDELMTSPQIISGSTGSSKTEQARLFVWSAAEESGVKRLADVYSKYTRSSLSASTPDFLANLSYTLSEKRSNLPWKGFAVADSVESLQYCLDNGLTTPIRSGRPPTLGFIFTGQGAQWYAMGRELLEYPVFKSIVEEASTAFRSFGCSWDLIDELMQSQQASRLSEPGLSQPICTALQIALVELMKTWNILPSVVIGHSSGEIATAYTVGGLSRFSAWKVAYYRGVVSQRLKDHGKAKMAMMSVGLSEAEAKEFLKESGICGDDVTIACHNSNKNVTLSGNAQAIDALDARFQKTEIFARKLKVDIAYHSKYMNAVATEYEQFLTDLQPGTPLVEKVSMFSSVTGTLISPAELSSSSYWVQNMTHPVLFLQAVNNICSDAKGMGGRRLGKASVRIDHLIEVGPHAALQGPLKEILSHTQRGKEIKYNSVLSRHKSAISTSLDLAGVLHSIGYVVDIATINSQGSSTENVSMLTDLPAYPFNHTKLHWLESRLSRNLRFRPHSHHELLGSTVPDWNPQNARWRNIISLEDHPWVEDHKVNGVCLYPAAGMLIMALEAARQVADAERQIVGYRFKDVLVKNAIVLKSSDAKVETELELSPNGERNGEFLLWNTFRLFTYENDSSSEACTGLIAVEYLDTRNDGVSSHEQRNARLSALVDKHKLEKQKCRDAISETEIYKHLTQAGLEYGPTFQTMRGVTCDNDGGASANVDLQEWKAHTTNTDIEPHFIHPAALDTILQLGIVALSDGGKKKISTMVPTRFDELWLSAKGNMMSPLTADGAPNTHVIEAHSKAIMNGPRFCDVSVTAVDAESGLPRLSMAFGATSVTAAESGLSSPAIKPLAYNLEWKPDLDLLKNDEISSYCASRVDKGRFRPASEHKVDEKLLYCTLIFWRANQGLGKDVSVHPKYAAWMKHMLSDEKLGPRFTRSQLHELSNNRTFMNWLEVTVEKCDPEGRMMARVGRNLQGILNGTVNSMELLFKDEAMSEYYRHASTAYKAFSEVNAYIDALSHKNPNLKVLEIGAGTGSGTMDLMEVLTHHGDNEAGSPRFSEYQFTDISPSFFKDAQEKFKDFKDRFHFSVLDISKDPVGQGLKEDYYDLVVASNVLHATQNIDTTLKNVHKVLKPGGKMVLYEFIAPESIRVGFIFGLFSGWWLSSEPNRVWSPLMPENQWDASLLNSGFGGIDCSFRDFEGDERSISGMLATALKKPEDPMEIESGGVYLVNSDITTVKNCFARELQNDVLNSMQLGANIIPLSDVDILDLRGSTCIILPTQHKFLLHEISEKDFGRIKKITSSAKHLLWVSYNSANPESNPTQGMIDGFRRSLSNELPELKFASLLLPDPQSQRGNGTDYISQVLKKLISPENEDMDLEYQVRDGLICVPRLVEANYMNKFLAAKKHQQPPQPTSFRQGHSRSLKLAMGAVASLDSFHFVDDERVSAPLGDTEIEIEVKASGLNFKDVLVALGQVSEYQIGIECAGIVSRTGRNTDFNVGDRVCAIVDESLSTFARCDSKCAVAVPENVRLVEAAALPISFSTAYFSINNLAKLTRGETVLIHSGAGGLGQACIQLAKLHGAEIFTTVGTKEKKEFLMGQYDIPDSHIFSSHTNEFVDAIKSATNGRGVDVIINSLSGEGLRNTWECIAPFGRFIETSMKDAISHNSLPMVAFSRMATFSGVHLIYLKNNNKNVMKQVLGDVMKLMEERKINAQEPLNIFNAGQIEDGFRLIQSGKSMGKVVIEFGEDDVVKAVPSTLPTYNFEETATYLIAGGLGGLGKSLALWMVNRGAKNLVLLSRSGPKDDTAKSFLKSLKRQGVNVMAPPCDITDRKSLSKVLAECSSCMPPIKGCIQSTMVLQDSTFDNMTRESYNAAVLPKVDGSWNLHLLLPRNLDFFVFLSSSSGIVGWHGQSNYASGNTYQDTLARHLTANGLRKAMSLDLGGIYSAGYVSTKDGLARQLESHGFIVSEEQELHRMLEYCCDPALETGHPIHSQLVTGFETPANMRAKGVDIPSWCNAPLFANLLQIRDRTAISSSEHSTSETFAEKVVNLTTDAEIGKEIVEAVAEKLAKTLAIDKGDIDTRKPMHIYGVDSLAAVEVRSWMKRCLGCEVAVFEILGNASIGELGRGLVGRCEFLRR
ncbi:hypothetical protein HYFRA_00002327, partial [Hymenoscyphus fraxineus]